MLYLTDASKSQMEQPKVAHPKISLRYVQNALPGL